MARQPAYRKKRHNRLGLMLVAVCVIVLISAIGVSSISLTQKRDAYAEREMLLAQQIQDEQNRTQELMEYEKYTKTNAFVEEVAKERLGLVYEGEILFRSN